MPEPDTDQLFSAHIEHRWMGKWMYRADIYYGKEGYSQAVANTLDEVLHIVKELHSKITSLNR